MRAKEQNALEFDDRSHLFQDHLGLAHDPHLPVFLASLRTCHTRSACALHPFHSPNARGPGCCAVLCCAVLCCAVVMQGERIS